MCYWKQSETQFPSAVQQQGSSHQQEAAQTELKRVTDSLPQACLPLETSNKKCLKLRLISPQTLKETELADTLLRATPSLCQHSRSSHQRVTAQGCTPGMHPRPVLMSCSSGTLSRTDWALEQLFRDLAKSDRVFARQNQKIPK